tara:strand:- start:298 stop:1095 length:798 start_codon:yes stop_codon:yes gene_type:complete
MGYFNVTVKPTIAASLQHAGNFTAQDVLFDWVSFDIPKGGAKLIGATILVRPKGNAGPTANPFGCFLVFSKSDNTSLGTVNGAANNVPNNDFIGHLEFEDSTSYAVSIPSTSVGVSGRSSNTNNQHPSMVFARDYDQPTAALHADGAGANVGYDRFYMGGLAEGEFFFGASLNAIAEDTDAEHADSKVITMDGTGMDVREHFIDGDVLHIGTSVGTPAADSLIGTVASADSATQITLDDVSPTALVDGDILYNIHPIRVILHFEN